MLAHRHQAGFTLIEIMVVVGLLAVLSVVALPALQQWQTNQRARSAIRSLGSTFAYARGEAIRTGNVHAVFFQADALGNTLLDVSGNAVPILILDDGRLASANQNCQIDAGEPIRAVAAEIGVSWGVTNATARVGTDTGTGAIATGASFTDPAGNPATWVLFRPDGMPLQFNSACTLGPPGSGGGAVYITNGSRDYAAVLTPLGAFRVHIWDDQTSNWSN